MENSVLERVKVAEKRVDYMERVDTVSRTAFLVGQLGKIVKLIREKISDHIEPDQPTFTNPVSLVSGVAYF